MTVIRKTDAQISVYCSPGWFSHNLYGSMFTVEIEADQITLQIDMSSNRRTRNKQSDRYTDAEHLEEHASKLQRVEIHDTQIIERWGRRAALTADCSLRLLFAKAPPETYNVEQQVETDRLVLKVISR